jgi:hypothetical protein
LRRHALASATTLSFPCFVVHAMMTASARRAPPPSVANAAPPSRPSAATTTTSTRTNVDCMNTPLGSFFELLPRVATSGAQH